MKLQKVMGSCFKLDYAGVKIIYFAYEEPVAFFDSMSGGSLYYAIANTIPGAASTTTKHINAIRNLHMHDAPHKVRTSQESLKQAIIDYF